MSEPIKASTQYGDLHGMIAFDGWHGLSLLSLGVGCPKGYWPVGIDIYGEPQQQGGDLDASVYILAIDETILEGKPGPDAVARYARAHEKLPVFRFSSGVKLSDLLKRISEVKRISIVLQDKSTRYVPLELAGGDTIYGDEPDFDEDEFEDDDESNSDD